jgi:hypothetical protein
LRALGAAAGLTLRREESFSLPMDLEGLLARSFPKPGNAERVRALFEEDIIAGQDALGVAARREDGAVKITYPVTVFAWGKP